MSEREERGKRAEREKQIKDGPKCGPNDRNMAKTKFCDHLIHIQ